MEIILLSIAGILYLVNEIYRNKNTKVEPPSPIVENLITTLPLPTFASWNRPKRDKDYIDYNTYILSEEWLTSAPRLNCIKAANNKCQMCGAGWGLAVHHIDYNSLGKELPQSLVLLCALCHEHTHKMAGKGARTYPPIRRPDYSSKSFTDLIKGI